MGNEEFGKEIWKIEEGRGGGRRIRGRRLITIERRKKKKNLNLNTKLLSFKTIK